MKKNNFFYIDETGHINNDSKIFIYGCIKTDTPNLLSDALEKLKRDLINDCVLHTFGEVIKTKNFHATGDPFDVRTLVFRLLPYLNFRAYFTVLIKEGKYYEELKKKNEDFEIIQMMLKKIIVPRISKSKEDENIFNIETLEIENNSLHKILEKVFSDIKFEHDSSYNIVDKSDSITPVIDYLNFILNKIFTEEKDIDWVKRAFEAVSDKIGLIHIMNDDSYYSSKGGKDNNIEYDILKSIKF